jgi:small GTP-binding protein
MSDDRKLVVLGDSGVGKTALVQYFVRRVFPAEYRPTAGAVPYKKTVRLGKRIVNLTIWDLAGHTLKLHPAFTSDAHGAVLVYDLSRQASFDSVLQWHQVIKNKVGDIPVIVAGNKSDIADTDKWEALKKAGYRGHKTSAKTGENVDRVFTDLVASI